LNYAFPYLEIEVRCGKGTYIRSLARDLGERLGCGALVEGLRRSQVGPFSDSEALSLDISAEAARDALRPLAEAVAELPHVLVDAAQAARLRHGQSIPYRLASD